MNSSEQRRELGRASPAGLGLVLNSAYQVPAHLDLLDRKLVEIMLDVVNKKGYEERGHGPRLMVFMPPRHGKSMTISRYGSSWFLGMFPDKRLAVASYEYGLAVGWGRQARNDLDEYGPELFGVRLAADPRAAGEWNVVAPDVDELGGFKAVGVGSGFTGRGADLLIIDDPLKDHEQAQSELIREKAKDWWETTARTRLMPGGGVILVMTRWHEDDLAGYLLQQEAEGIGDEWDVISLPGLAEKTCSATYPDGVRELGPDPLGRAEGEALWPTQFPQRVLERTRRGTRAHWFAAMFQQRPAPAEGGMFKTADWRYWTGDYHGRGKGEIILATDEGPFALDLDYATSFQTIDTAATEDTDGDYTVISTWCVAPHGQLVLLDRFRERLEVPDQPGAIIAQHGEHDPAAVYMEEVAANAAKGVRQALRRKGHPIGKLTADKDKITRAIPASIMQQDHQVFIPARAEWRREWEAEHRSFPNSAHDDQVDTFAYAARKAPDVMKLKRRGRGDDERRRRPVTASLGAGDH